MIRLNEGGPASPLADLIGHGLTQFCAASGDDHLGPFVRKQQGGGFADARGPAGDQGDAAAKFAH
jgi:hypothetical protein